MSRNRDDWLTQIKAVERDYLAAEFAIDRLLESAHADPTILRRNLGIRDLTQASARLEATYFIRLFAVFESGLRGFWQVQRRRRIPRTEHLLNSVASARGIPNDLRVNTHAVRRYRNSLVHEQDEEIEPIPVGGGAWLSLHILQSAPPKVVDQTPDGNGTSTPPAGFTPWVADWPWLGPAARSRPAARRGPTRTAGSRRSVSQASPGSKRPEPPQRPCRLNRPRT
jgi:hypothetical protein